MSNVLVIDDIPVDIPLVDMTKYSHLEGLPSHADLVVDVLIGQDHAVELRSLLLLFAFQSMFISIWVSRLEIAEFPESVRRFAP